MDQSCALKVGLSVTAMARQGQQTRSVDLRFKGRVLELLHLEQGDSWQALAQQAKVIDESGKRLAISS